jgi:tetratricopeptide (TPR) repeat protein
MDRAPAYYPALRVRAALRLRTGFVTDALQDTTTLCFAGYRERMPADILQRLRYTARWSSRLTRLDRTTLCPSRVIGAADLLTRAEIYSTLERPDAMDWALIYLAMAERLGADPAQTGLLRALSVMSGQQTPDRGKLAENMLKALQKAHPQVASKADYHYALGKAFYSQNAIKEAAKAYREALQRQPAHLRALRALGWLLLGAKQSAAAATIFRTAVQIADRWEADPFRVRARLQFGLGQSLLGKGGDLKGAGAALTEALRLNGQLYQAAVALARVHLATKRTEAAEKQLEEVLGADPEYPDALLLLATLRRSDPKTKAEAQTLLTRLVKVCAREIRSGRPEEARYWLEQILTQADKTHATASLLLGTLLTRYSKEGTRARELLKQAGNAAPPKWLEPVLARLRKR